MSHIERKTLTDTGCFLFQGVSVALIARQSLNSLLQSSTSPLTYSTSVVLLFGWGVPCLSFSSSFSCTTYRLSFSHFKSPLKRQYTLKWKFFSVIV